MSAGVDAGVFSVVVFSVGVGTAGEYRGENCTVCGQSRDPGDSVRTGEGEGEGGVSRSGCCWGTRRI